MTKTWSRTASRRNPGLPGGPRVVGTTGAYVAQELARVHAEVRRMTWAWLWRSRIPRRMAGAGIALGVLVVLDGRGWWYPLVLGALGLVASVFWSGLYARPRALQRWDRWGRTRRRVDRALLQGLDERWVVLPDRAAPELPGPATIIVGPSGPWAIWIQEPTAGPPSGGDQALAEELFDAVCALADAPAGGSWVVRAPYAGPDTRELVAAIRTARVVVGPRQVAAAAARLEVTTRAEPLEAVPG